jgi:hypothetical protein
VTAGFARGPGAAAIAAAAFAEGLSGAPAVAAAT